MMFTDRRLSDEVYIYRSKKLAGFLRQTGRWHSVDWVANQVHVTLAHVVGVIASGLGFPHHLVDVGISPSDHALERDAQSSHALRPPKAENLSSFIPL